MKERENVGIGSPLDVGEKFYKECVWVAYVERQPLQSLSEQVTGKSRILVRDRQEFPSLHWLPADSLPALFLNSSHVLFSWELSIAYLWLILSHVSMICHFCPLFNFMVWH